MFRFSGVTRESQSRRGIAGWFLSAAVSLLVVAGVAWAQPADGPPSTRQARRQALWRLGHTAKGAGDPTQARDHYETALALFTQIGSPQAEKVQADLDGLEEG